MDKKYLEKFGYSIVPSNNTDNVIVTEIEYYEDARDELHTLNNHKELMVVPSENMVMFALLDSIDIHGIDLYDHKSRLMDSYKPLIELFLGEI